MTVEEADLSFNNIAQSNHYAAIWNRAGIPEENQSDEYFFMDRSPDGTMYPIPRQIAVDGLSYQLTERGALVSDEASIEGEWNFGSRTIIERYCNISCAQIGDECKLGEGAQVIWSIVENGVKIGRSAIIGPSAKVHSNVSIGENCNLDEGSVIWQDAFLAKGVQLGRYAVLESGTKIGEHCYIASESKVGKNSCVLPGIRVAEGKKIKPETVVYPKKAFRRAKSI